MLFCHACGGEVQVGEKILRRDECPHCGRDLRCCRNCRHFDPRVHNQCREVVAEWVADKERGNFCEYFDPTASSRRRARGGAEEEAREKWRKLFKT
jgi:hypothetical protein